MAELYGKNYNRTDLLKRIGNLAQVAGIREYTYNSGRADGVKAVEVNTGLLKFEILPSRCLDISFASYCGVPFSYITKSGVRHPAYYSQVDPRGFLGNFFAGALTTCGMHNIGGPAELEGVRHEQHGEVHSMPAEKVSVSEVWNGDDCEFTISGEVHHSQFYAHDLILRRTIKTRLGANCYTIEDEVENLDFAPSPCFLLYHSQFGYPFLDADTKLFTSPAEKVAHRGGIPEGKRTPYDKFDAPTDGREEECYFHTFKPDAKGMATACLFNPKLGSKGMGVYVRFDTSTLPRFVEWKMLRSREYVCGLEPGTTPLDNRTDADIKAATIQPLQKRRHRLEYGVIEGEAECRKFVGA